MTRWLLVSLLIICGLGHSLYAQELILSTTGKIYTAGEQIWVNLSVKNATAIPGAYKLQLEYDFSKLTYETIQSAGSGPFVITPAVTAKNGTVTIAGFQGIVDSGKGDASLITLIFTPVGNEIKIDSSSFTIKEQKIFSAQGTPMDLKITGLNSTVLLPPKGGKLQQQISITSNYIQFTVPNAGLTSARVFDLSGRTVAFPLKPAFCKEGRQAVPLGKQLRSGIYIVRVNGAGFNTIRKLEVVQ